MADGIAASAQRPPGTPDPHETHLTRVVAVRHGETVWNAEMRMQGQLDTALSARGRWQAGRAAESLVSELLPVLDNLERALDASEHHEEAKVSEGVQLVRQQLVDLLRRRGLEEIASEPGSEFDPHLHEALSQQPSDHPEGAISEVWQRGYTLGDRVMRPARVVVSSGSPTEDD